MFSVMCFLLGCFCSGTLAVTLKSDVLFNLQWKIIFTLLRTCAITVIQYNLLAVVPGRMQEI